VDFARYSIDLPTGWSSRVEGERRVIYPAADENDCVIAPVAMDTSANLAGGEVGRQMWSTLTSGRRVLQAHPTQDGRDPGGRIWTVDSAVIEQGGGIYVLALSVVELNRRAEGFVLVATPPAVERHQNAIDAILYSVRPRLSALAASQARDTALATGQPGPLGSAKPGRFAGVWTATTHELRWDLGGTTNKPVASELILFADDAALWGMPPEGLLGFDRAAHRKRWPERWGSYVMRDKLLVIKRGSEQRLYAVLADGTLENRYMEGGQERTGERFVPRASLDGVALDGEVRRKDHWPAPGNTSGIGTLPGCTFSRDGTFRDEKLMWIVLPEREGASQEAHAARVAPGQGRYTLKHWTLLLEYDDGRVNQVSFIATDSDLPAKGAILNGFPVEPRP
jgi:hypothetical protein